MSSNPSAVPACSHLPSAVVIQRSEILQSWLCLLLLKLICSWLMRTGLCSCLSLLQQGNETMADRLLVLVPHEHTHAPRSILEQARKVGPDVTEMRAIKHTMELIAHSLCIANGAPAKVARDGWPGKTALLNGQRMVICAKALLPWKGQSRVTHGNFPRPAHGALLTCS